MYTVSCRILNNERSQLGGVVEPIFQQYFVSVKISLCRGWIITFLKLPTALWGCLYFLYFSEPCGELGFPASDIAYTGAVTHKIFWNSKISCVSQLLCRRCQMQEIRVPHKVLRSTENTDIPTRLWGALKK